MNVEVAKDVEVYLMKCFSSSSKPKIIQRRRFYVLARVCGVILMTHFHDDLVDRSGDWKGREKEEESDVCDEFDVTEM